MFLVRKGPWEHLGLASVPGPKSHFWVTFEPLLRGHFAQDLVGDRKGTAKRLCDKDFAERSGELSGVICLNNPCFTGK